MDLFNKKQDALSIGARGESAALRYLEKKGYKILDTNFCNKSGRRLGEIDIIAQESGQIVFVEVKTRKFSENNVLPEENITRSKLYKLNKIASFYLGSKNLRDYPYRFDAITLVADLETNSASLRHLKNIFL